MEEVVGYTAYHHQEPLQKRFIGSYVCGSDQANRPLSSVTALKPTCAACHTRSRMCRRTVSSCPAIRSEARKVQNVHCGGKSAVCKRSPRTDADGQCVILNIFVRLSAVELRRRQAVD